MNTETQTEQIPAVDKSEEEICQIGVISATLAKLYPNKELDSVVQGYRDAYQGKRLKIEGEGILDVVEVFADPSNSAKIMARLRRVDGK